MNSRQYIDNQVSWVQKIMNAEFKSVRQAVEKESTSMNEWKESHNNLQRQMKEQGATYVTRKELWGAVVTVITDCNCCDGID